MTQRAITLSVFNEDGTTTHRVYQVGVGVYDELSARLGKPDQEMFWTAEGGDAAAEYVKHDAGLMVIVNDENDEEPK